MQAQAASVFERLAKVLKQSLESKKAESEKVVAALQAKKDGLVKANGEQKELQDKYRAVRRKIVEAEEALAQQTARSRMSVSERSQ